MWYLDFTHNFSKRNIVQNNYLDILEGLKTGNADVMEGKGAFILRRLAISYDHYIDTWRAIF